MTYSITDPAVTLTDYALAIECVVLGLLLLRQQPRDATLRFWFAVFFAAAAAASLLGGTVHGFFKAPDSSGRAILWPTTLLTILLSGVAAWCIAAHLVLRPTAERLARVFAVVLAVTLSAVVLFVSRNFLVAIVGYLPATFFLLYAFVAVYRRNKTADLRWGIIGMVLTLVAAVIQRLHVSIHPEYFDHNALYHVIQGAAFWMIFVAARALSTTSRSSGGTNAITA